MKWLISVTRFLNSQRYHLHASNPVGLSKSYQIKSSSSMFSGQCYSTTRILNATKSSDRLIIGTEHEEKNIKKNVDVEIISRETIKPTSPTPPHLRTFNLSILDQYIYGLYVPMILFLPNTNNASVADVRTKRLKHLKETLSDVLTQFYPFAGRIKDNLHIECNDEGVYYMEARVNETLQDFLRNPYDEKVRELTPDRPHITESYILGIQVNIFNCGGIGIGASMSHKIFDGPTYLIFMKAWAAAASGSSEKISPSFCASEIFPNNPNFLETETAVPSKYTSPEILSTKTLFFDSTALALLKAQPVGNANSSKKRPTRTEATAAVIWKAAAKAASIVRPFTPQSPHVVIAAVSLRERSSPPLPKNSIGNLISVADAMCFPAGSQLDLPTLMGKLRELYAKTNSNHIESMKGVKGHETVNEMFMRLNHRVDVTRVGDCMTISSLLNSGVYEFDFGWGKPIWFYAMHPGIARFVYLNETLKGDGVEATVTLSSVEMGILEHDHELLSYATFN